jgi:hypothetical protein
MIAQSYGRELSEKVSRPSSTIPKIFAGTRAGSGPGLLEFSEHPAERRLKFMFEIVKPNRKFGTKVHCPRRCR